MNEFEDRQLAARLGRLGGEQPDDNVAYTAVLGRVRRARRRRAAALAGGSMLGLALLATAVAINTGQSDRSLRPAAPNTSDVDDTVDVTAPVRTDVPGTETTAPTTGDSVVTSVTATDGSVDSESTAAGGSTSPSSVQPDQTPASTPPSPPPSSPPSSPTPTPPPTSAATTSTFSGVGGSITVRLQNGTLSLLASSPAAGFTVQVTHGGGQRVEVLFSSDDHETRIRVDLSGGAMDPEVDENDSDGGGDGGDSGPDETDD